MMNPPSEIALSQAGPDSASGAAMPGYPALPPRDATVISAAFTADRILAHPALAVWIRQQAQALVLTHQANPRVTSPFATQQRWLMSQVALAKYFRNEAGQPGTGVLAERFIELVLEHDLASRNTAGAFLRELLKYGIVRHVANSEGRRHRPFEPSPGTLAILHNWLAIHLATLDGLDSGRRSAALQSRPELLAAMQPVIADGLLASGTVRQPEGTFSLFTWINDGGIVMDRLIAGCQDDEVGPPRLRTDITSVSSLSQHLNLSRSQLSRKFIGAEAMGSLGWTRGRGKSPLWISAAFQREYHVAQAAKLAIIDAAFAAYAVSAQDLHADHA
jgi:AraC-like DNA-binding protein